MPRLFTALEVPAAIAERLAMLRGGLPGARWIDTDNFHITLRFLGDVDDRTARDAAMMLAGRPREPISVSLGELDAFGGTRPRSLIAKVQPSEALLDLQAEQERVLRRVGLPAESRRYTPHVTLARLRDVSARAVADWLAASGGPPKLEFTAERFVLLSSRASTGGGPYVVEKVYPLGGWTHEDDEEEESADEALW
jgi:2'-5' RNA ligase